MTHKYFSLALAVSCLVLFVFRSDIFTLSALIVAVSAHVLLELLPLAMDTRADALRKELSELLAKHTAEIETLNSKVNNLVLGRR